MSVSVSALLHGATMPTTPEVGAQQAIALITPITASDAAIMTLSFSICARAKCQKLFKN